MEKNVPEVNMVVASGINFPHLSRKYLMNLLADVVHKHDADFVVVAGNMMAGRHLETELSYLITQEKDAKRGKKNKFTEEDKISVIQEFIQEKAEALNEFLPHLGTKDKTVNYHIVLAEKIYDRPIGAEIIQKLQTMRDDIRLFNDPEAKIPINVPGLESMRVLVPRRQPWFYKIITGLMQRLIDAFISRTFSPKPSFIVVGCTGTGVTIPYYKGVPSLSVPALHKIDEQFSTENMVGCLALKVSAKNGKIHLIVRTYDWRTAIFYERKYAIAQQTSKKDRIILNALKPSTASLKTLVFRINQRNKTQLDPEKVKRLLDNLEKRKLVVFDKRGNRYGINERLIEQTKITLNDLIKKDNKLVKHLVGSCFHIGALKTLYFTLLEDLPKLAMDVDAFVLNGDILQGIAHNYEYNGELLPIAYGYDKQNILAAHLFHVVFWKVFKKRFRALEKEELAKKRPIEILKSCLLALVLNLGNHDLWEVRSKNAIALSQFEERFKNLLLKDILAFCSQHNLQVKISEIGKLINEKFIRVGENGIAEVGGVRFGLKHAHKARTLSKSQRAQESTAWFEEQKLKNVYNLPLIYVANFHEAAAVHIAFWGRTIFSVMTGAFLKDTQFEKNKDKVVDHGVAKVTVNLNKNRRIIFTEVEFDSYINPKDQEIVFANKLTTTSVLQLCLKLSKLIDLPWRA